jgi:hypothetical protein
MQLYLSGSPPLRPRYAQGGKVLKLMSDGDLLFPLGILQL